MGERFLYKNKDVIVPERCCLFLTKIAAKLPPRFFFILPVALICKLSQIFTQLLKTCSKKFNNKTPMRK